MCKNLSNPKINPKADLNEWNVFKWKNTTSQRYYIFLSYNSQIQQISIKFQKDLLKEMADWY